MALHDKVKEKKFVCVEHGEIFVIGSSDFETAQEEAGMYGGEACRELSLAEYASHDGRGGYSIKKI